MTNRAHLADFLAGDDAPAGVELLRAALRRWVRSDGTLPLERYLGLRSPLEFRRLERDRWLRAATVHVDNAAALAAAIRRFERCSWRDADVAPAGADELSACLLYARKAAPLPASVKHLQRIVRNTETEKQVRAAAA